MELTSISHLIHCVAKASDHKQLKISTPEQMLWILQTALAHVKAGNTSEHLLN